MRIEFQHHFHKNWKVSMNDKFIRDYGNTFMLNFILFSIRVWRY